MVIKLFNDLVTAEGEAIELAVYTHTVLEIFKMKAEFDAEKKDKEFLEKFGDFSILDLIRSEMRDDSKHEEENGGENGD